MMYVVAFLLSLVRTVANGYVLSKLWAWFVVPAFGVPALPTLRAIGVMMVLNFLSLHLHAEIIKAQPKSAKPRAALKDWVNEYLVAILLVCPLILGISYLWHLAIVAWS